VVNEKKPGFLAASSLNPLKPKSKLAEDSIFETEKPGF
jgi:hypothetical protein